MAGQVSFSLSRDPVQQSVTKRIDDAGHPMVSTSVGVSTHAFWGTLSLGGARIAQLAVAAIDSLSQCTSDRIRLAPIKPARYGYLPGLAVQLTGKTSILFAGAVSYWYK